MEPARKGRPYAEWKSADLWNTWNADEFSLTLRFYQTSWGRNSAVIRVSPMRGLTTWCNQRPVMLQFWFWSSFSASAWYFIQFLLFSWRYLIFGLILIWSSSSVESSAPEVRLQLKWSGTSSDIRKKNSSPFSCRWTAILQILSRSLGVAGDVNVS